MPGRAPTNTNAELTEPWRELWNGDLTLADTIIDEDFVAHAAPLMGVGADEIHGREALQQWVAGIHQVLLDLTFLLDVGPITDEDYLVVRWKAQGTYAGGFPGASDAAVGNVITFSGTDTLRVKDGMLVEYWANADSLLFVQQLGVKEVPGVSV